MGFDVQSLIVRLAEKGYSLDPNCKFEGGFGQVFFGVSTQADSFLKPVVFKIVASSSIDRSYYVMTDNGPVLQPNEVYCLLTLSTVPGIIKYVNGFYITPDFYCIILERNPNALSLTAYITENGCLEEDDAKFIMKQMVTILCNVRDAGICYDDITSSNFLIDTSTGDITLIDFGAAHPINSIPECVVGTVSFMSPECLGNVNFSHLETTAAWALGIILYNMIYGYLPYTSESDIGYNILWFDPNCDWVSNEVKDLIAQCLTTPVYRRIGLRNILNHPWINS